MILLACEGPSCPATLGHPYFFQVAPVLHHPQGGSSGLTFLGNGSLDFHFFHGRSGKREFERVTQWLPMVRH